MVKKQAKTAPKPKAGKSQKKTKTRSEKSKKTKSVKVPVQEAPIVEVEPIDEVAYELEDEEQQQQQLTTTIDEIVMNGQQQCPYLDTINRAVLDFDFEKLCSVSLTHLNVYACLVCGKYFQGRHKNSHAYIHSVEYGHYVWINLESLKFYCLPDNYEIVDSSLEDIKRQVKPHFDQHYIQGLEDPNVEHQKTLRCLDGTTYHPGVLGMNNIKETDYMNVVMQSLSFVQPFRNFFLNDQNYVDIRRPSSDNLYTLLIRFGELTRKLWNNINFRSHISPHEMVQAVVLASKKHFNLEKQSDPIQFLAWLLNNLHQSLNWNNRNKNSVVYKTFRGKIKVFVRQMKINELGELEDDDAVAQPNETHTQIQPFLFVPLEIPPPPLFKDEVEGNVIAQISLHELLEKYNGTKEHITSTYEIKRFSFVQLPKYLIFCLKRFSYNYFFTERNPTIVNFNINCLDMSEFVDSEALNNLPPNTSTVYRLIANIVISQESMLDGADKPAYLLQIYHKGLDKWFEIQDLHIKEIMPQMITISESYIQIWEQQLS